jgi:hypothetical protein
VRTRPTSREHWPAVPDHWDLGNLTEISDRRFVTRVV